MTHQEIREKFRAFFESKGHVWVPSSSLLPSDPSVLFTTAGMQQFKPYYTGAADAQKDFGSLDVASIQKCMRTSDIDEVGDESHLTFFEMLGNFSFGGYWKKEAIQYAYEFITKEMGLKIDYVTIFDPDKVPKDDVRCGLGFDSESYEVWKELGFSEEKIHREGLDNFWGPTGKSGPCGPTTEIYVGGIEIWNIVFNQFLGTITENSFRWESLKKQGIDTGMGLERLAMVSQKVPTVFDTDLFAPIMALLPSALDVRIRRIIADHARAIAFLISDGVTPSNKEQGYVLRRLIRRIIVHRVDMQPLFELVAQQHGLDIAKINTVFTEESVKFTKTLDRGLKELEQITTLDAEMAFMLYESYGLPYEIIKDVACGKAAGLTREAFDEKFKEHQEKSRTASAGMFKGGLADQSERVVKYHTTTHLLNAALRKVLGEHIMQKGSNINAERLRFDFSHPEKMTDEQKADVEQLVNEWITRDLPVTREEMSQEEARKLGAIGAFGEKYDDVVSVYTVGDPAQPVSREMCGGPHVEHTGKIGTFKIIKEEAVSAGVRRIKAVIS